jgi:hypothetical protein
MRLSPKPQLPESNIEIRSIATWNVERESGSTPPVQRNRTRQRMFPRPLQTRLFQREVPLRRLVGIINQHQPRIEPQPLRLLHHRLLILPHKPRPKERSNRSHKWHMIKNIPRRHHINPASRRRNRRHSRQTRKPLLSRTNRLVPPIRQHKINRRRDRLPINPQQLIRCRVRARSMRRHPKPGIPSLIFVVVQWLKVLRLLMNTRPAPPPPRLVHKRPMRRIHQPDDPMIDIARQLRHQMRTPKLRRKLRHLRHRRQRLTHPPRTRRRYIYPRKPIPLLTRKRARKNLRRVQRLVARQRRNLLALPATGLKPPPVILARHRLTIKPPRRQRNPSMRTQITHRKQPPTRLPPQQHRDPKQHRLRRLALTQFAGPQRPVPIPEDQLRRRPRDLRNSHQLTQSDAVPFIHDTRHTAQQTRSPIIAATPPSNSPALIPHLPSRRLC